MVFRDRRWAITTATVDLKQEDFGTHLRMILLSASSGEDNAVFVTKGKYFPELLPAFAILKPDSSLVFKEAEKGSAVVMWRIARW